MCIPVCMYTQYKQTYIEIFDIKWINEFLTFGQIIIWTDWNIKEMSYNALFIHPEFKLVL